MGILNLTSVEYMKNYSLLCDIGIIYLSTLLICMLSPFASFKEKSNRKLLLICLSLIDIACIANTALHAAIVCGLDFHIYICHFIYCVSLAIIFFIFTYFYSSLLIGANKAVKRIRIISYISITIYVIFKVAGYFDGAFTITNNQTIQINFLLDPSWIYYFLLGTLNIIMFIFFDNKNNMTHKPVKVSATITYIFFIISMILLNTTSLNTLLFIAPMIALMYYHHSYSFEVMTGAADYRGMQHYIKKNIMRGKYNASFSGTLFYLYGADSTSEYLAKIQMKAPKKYKLKLFTYETKNQYIYLYSFKYSEDIQKFLKQEFDNLPFSYIAYSFNDINNTEDIFNILKSVFNSFTHRSESTWETLSKADIEKINREAYIRNQIFDICNQKNVNDERVKVFCQPIYNVKAQKYDTAEALMRLNIPELGLIYPDEFIPIAERYQMIHFLTLILLNKVCHQIMYLNKNGFIINRISVNFSVLELGNTQLKDEVINMINNHNIECAQIALEVTESMNNVPTDELSKILTEIKEKGIMIYLDDFGTGYSNFSRLFELPFDVIKFDKSLLIKNNRTQKNCTDIFNSIIPKAKEYGFKLVHEGIETDLNEKECIELGFDYLQGYRYSKPIPIEDLKNFLEKQ